MTRYAPNSEQGAPGAAAYRDEPPYSQDTDRRSDRRPRIDESSDGHHGVDRIRSLLSGIRDDVALLAKQEFALARNETRENIREATTHLGNTGMYAAALIVGLTLFLAGCSIGLGVVLEVAGLTAGPAYTLGFVAVGLLVTLLAGLGLRGALHKLAHEDPVPTRTLRSVADIAEQLRPGSHADRPHSAESKTDAKPDPSHPNDPERNR